MTTAPVTVLRLSTRADDFHTQLSARLQWSAQIDSAIEQRVAAILADVKQRGEAAVLHYTAQFDGLSAESLSALEISQAERQAAFEALPSAQRHALQAAAQRIRSYHEAQKKAGTQSWSYRDEDGSLLGQKVTPIDRVGIYVPGGKAAYPSSVLMNAIPARVAGVSEIIMVVPTPRGEKNALVLAAAHVAGVNRVLTIGGAQAIAALAYGTATLHPVDKIVGPGNAYVASAKKHVFGTVGIDMIAGPSEILVLADGTTPAHWVAMDLFSQAEHDELAQSILLCPDGAYLDAVQVAMNELLPSMPRAAIIAQSLRDRGAFIHTRDMHEACALSNRIAPEHLEVSSAQPERWEPLLTHAGALFLGAYTSESLGDYCAGPNHVLPTSGTARFSSALGVYDFQKRTSLIEVSAAGAQTLGPIAAELAYGEGLQAHARAAQMRLHIAAETGTQTAFSSPASPAPHPAPLSRSPLSHIRQDIQSLHAYAVQDARGMLKLDAMENPFTLPPQLQTELGKRLGAAAINRYPGAAIDQLKEALARHIDLPPGCALMLGNGSDELISLLAMACDLPQGACVLAPEPGFVMYAMSAQLQGLRYHGVPLTAEFELDAAAMLAAMQAHKPALTYLAYPNNPTANLWDANVIRQLIAEAAQFGGIVVIDEAYQPFSSYSWIDDIRAHPSAHAHVLLMRTLSKFGLAGVRLGYLVGAQTLVHEIDKLRPPYNISVLNAECALFALEHTEVYAHQAAQICAQRAVLLAALAALPGVRPFPSQANMVLARVPDAQRCFEALKAQGILVKNVSRMHPLLHHCLRLTVGTPAENARLIGALQASL